MTGRGTIQDRITLLEICKELSNGPKTKTYIKRSIGLSETEMNSSILFGSNIGIIIEKKHGYVERHREPDPLLEEHYYDCIRLMLTRFYEKYVSDNGKYLISKTARKDTKIAGRWTRPDFTVILNRKFEYIKEVEFDIVTFEIKRPSDCEAIAVFEALAHNSSATRSYVFFPITEDDLNSHVQGDRIREECARHGIGLFLVEDRKRLDTARLLIESQRKPLNPEKCSQFLRSVLEAPELAKLTTW